MSVFRNENKHKLPVFSKRVLVVFGLFIITISSLKTNGM